MHPRLARLQKLAFVAVTLVTITALVGCAATRERGKRLLGTPRDGGLLIVDCRLLTNFAEGPEEAALDKFFETGATRSLKQDSMDEVAIQRRDQPGRYYYGTQFAGVLVFPHLDPGPYILRSMGHGRHFIDNIKGQEYYLAKRQFPFGGATGNLVTFEITSGGLSYVGGLDVTAYYGLRLSGAGYEFVETDQQWRAVIDYEPTRERNAWVKLLRMSEGTHWEGQIVARIDALNSGVRFGPPN